MYAYKLGGKRGREYENGEQTHVHTESGRGEGKGKREREKHSLLASDCPLRELTSLRE